MRPANLMFQGDERSGQIRTILCDCVVSSHGRDRLCNNIINIIYFLNILKVIFKQNFNVVLKYALLRTLAFLQDFSDSTDYVLLSL